MVAVPFEPFAVYTLNILTSSGYGSYFEVNTVSPLIVVDNAGTQVLDVDGKSGAELLAVCPYAIDTVFIVSCAIPS